MDRRRFALLTLGAASLAVVRSAAAADEPPTTWDGLVRVESKKLRLVYLAPGADFRPYSKVMLDPTEVAFRKNWRRDYNSNEPDLEQQVPESYVQNAVKNGVKASDQIFNKAFEDGGYPVVTAPAADVLRVSTAILNISVTAPDIMSADASLRGAGNAGQAMFVVEARDSQTQALMGRGIDEKLAGDTGAMIRTSVTNAADFRELVRTWAKSSVVGLNELKSLSPVNPATLSK